MFFKIQVGGRSVVCSDVTQHVVRILTKAKYLIHWVTKAFENFPKIRSKNPTVDAAILKTVHSPHRTRKRKTPGPQTTAALAFAIYHYFSQEYLFRVAP